jgi:hypothetical protein
MTVPNGDRPGLEHALHEKAREVAREQRSVRNAAIAAALEADPKARAFRLVHLAGALRDDGDHSLALHVLDVLLEQQPPHEAELAAWSCAIAIHCDLGDPIKGYRLGERVRATGVDEHLLNALVRAYWDAFQKTGVPALREKWQRCSEDLEQLRAPATS